MDHMGNRPNKPCCGGKKKFPSLTKALGKKDLVKVVTENGSVLVANDVAVEYLYQQHLEGVKKARVIMPTGEEVTRKFINPEVSSGAAVGIQDEEVVLEDKRIIKDEYQHRKPPVETRIEDK